MVYVYVKTRRVGTGKHYRQTTRTRMDVNRRVIISLTWDLYGMKQKESNAESFTAAL